MEAIMNTNGLVIETKELLKKVMTNKNEALEIGAVSDLTRGAGYGGAEWTGSKLRAWLGVQNA